MQLVVERDVILPFFFVFQNAMNLPPDKARLLRQYDNEKKWELICDQVRNNDAFLYQEIVKEEISSLNILDFFVRRCVDFCYVILPFCFLGSTS